MITPKNVEKATSQPDPTREESTGPEIDTRHFDADLRIDEDGEHCEDFRLTYKIAMAIFGCSMAFVGSQLIPFMWFTLYPFVAKELGATTFVWLKAGSSIGQIAASITLGPLSDLLGRKIIFLSGAVCCIIGMIACAATQNQAGFIAGQTIAGFGLITEELLAIAITAELVPAMKRNIYVAAIISGFLPWTPGVLYAQLLATYNWRWVGCLIAVWHIPTVIVLAIFYRPPSRLASRGLTPREIIDRVDFIGVALGLTGFSVFTIGLLWGGADYPWDSSHVIGTLVAGLATVIAFIVWEVGFAKHPLFPRRLVHVKRVFWPILLVIFMSNTNFGPLAIFWPIQSTSVYGSDHKQLGVNALPVGFCFVGGVVISALLCTYFPKYVRSIMTVFCVLQTAGAGGMAGIDRDNINTVWAPLVFAIVGVSGVLIPNQVILTVVTPDDLIATVTSLTLTVRSVSQIVALAIFTNRLSINVAEKAPKLVVPAALQAGVRTIPEVIDLIQSLTSVPFKDYVPQNLPYITDTVKYELLRGACVDLYSKSFPELWWIAFGFGVAACVASLFIGDVTRYMDGHVAAVLL